MPLRVSIEAAWPMATDPSLCVSAILISALRRFGSATRARLVPGVYVLADFDRDDLENTLEFQLEREAHPVGCA